MLFTNGSCFFMQKLSSEFRQEKSIRNFRITNVIQMIMSSPSKKKRIIQEPMFWINHSLFMISFLTKMSLLYLIYSSFVTKFPWTTFQLLHIKVKTDVINSLSPIFFSFPNGLSAIYYAVTMSYFLCYTTNNRDLRTSPWYIRVI